MIFFLIQKINNWGASVHMCTEDTCISDPQIDLSLMGHGDGFCPILALFSGELMIFLMGCL